MAESTENTENKALVYTVKNLCKVCYTCVRECPVKAIKIINGQAEVIPERCIACGNCVKVCSQKAKVFRRSGTQVLDLLQGPDPVFACVAPSFPAEFSEIKDPGIFVGMLRKLGFKYVLEVSFGADLVAAGYLDIFNNPQEGPRITSDCPAVVNYIEKYHPELVPCLAPIASPAMAVAEVIRKKYGSNSKMVFIGPCIAKKSESDYFNQVLTFSELREMLAENEVLQDEVEISAFDPPHSGKGALFPVNHGLLQTINKHEGFGKGEVITAEGKPKFMEAIRDLEAGILEGQHLELLCCDGCIQGPGMSSKSSIYERRKNISEYVKWKMATLDEGEWKRDVKAYADLDLSRSYEPADQRLADPLDAEVEKVLLSMGRAEDSDMLNCGACGYETCREHAVAVVEGLAETEMCLPYAIEKLHESVNDLNTSNKKLADTRQALKQSEKLASMGQVSAGIAHELNNPLGIITLYSSILRDELETNSNVYRDISLIDEQAQRCQKIVGGLLNFARKKQVNLEECNLIDFVEKSFESLIVPDDVEIKFEHKLPDPLIRIDRDQMMQVLTNLLRNAIEAMPGGGILKVELKQGEGDTSIIISDTGSGIAEENMEKIFTPFFTTKDSGKGTGLGLPLAYGIVKMHKGKISAVSNDDPAKGDTGTTFTIVIPVNIK